MHGFENLQVCSFYIQRKILRLRKYIIAGRLDFSDAGDRKQKLTTRIEQKQGEKGVFRQRKEMDTALESFGLPSSYVLSPTPWMRLAKAEMAKFPSVNIPFPQIDIPFFDDSQLFDSGFVDDYEINVMDSLMDLKLYTMSSVTDDEDHGLRKVATATTVDSAFSEMEEEQNRQAIRIQTWIRGILQRKRTLRILRHERSMVIQQSATKIQALARGVLARNRFENMPKDKAMTLFQRVPRGIVGRRNFKITKANTKKKMNLFSGFLREKSKIGGNNKVQTKPRTMVLRVCAIFKRKDRYSKL